MKAQRRGATFGKAWYAKPRPGVTEWDRRLKLIKFNLRPLNRQLRQLVSGVGIAWGRIVDLVKAHKLNEKRQRDYALAGPSDE